TRARSGRRRSPRNLPDRKRGGAYATAAAPGQTPAALARAAAQPEFRRSRGAGEDQGDRREPDLPPGRSRPGFPAAPRYARRAADARLPEAADIAQRARRRPYDRRV